MAKAEIRQLVAAVGINLMATRAGGVGGTKDKGILHFG